VGFLVDGYNIRIRADNQKYAGERRISCYLLTRVQI